MQLTVLSLCILLVCNTVWGMHFSFGRDSDYNLESLKLPHVGQLYGPIENFSVSSNLTEVDTTEYSQASDATLRIEENNSSLSASDQPVSSTYTTISSSSSSDIQSVENSTTVVNKSQSTEFSSNETSATTNEGTTFEKKFSTLTTPSSSAMNATTLTTDDDEPEGVARGKPSTTESLNTTTTQPQTLYERGLALIGDPYTLSILVPVAAGVVFATTIILTIATCRCIRRRCIRRRLRRTALPDSVKNLRPSDRARLLAETSDEEF